MNHNILHGDTRAIMVEETFPHAPDVVWRVLTTPELVGRWLKMAPTGFVAEIGNQFTYKTTPAGEWDGTIHCQVLELVPGERLVYSWQGGHADNVGYGSLLDLTVSMFLEPVAGGTKLRVIHSGFDLPRNETAFGSMSGGWKGVVTRIAEITDEQTRIEARKRN